MIQLFRLLNKGKELELEVIHRSKIFDGRFVIYLLVFIFILRCLSITKPKYTTEILLCAKNILLHLNWFLLFSVLVVKDDKKKRSLCVFIPWLCYFI